MKGKTVELLRRERMDTKLSTLIALFVATKQTDRRSDATIRRHRDKLQRDADSGEWGGSDDQRCDSLFGSRLCCRSSDADRDVRQPPLPAASSSRTVQPYHPRICAHSQGLLCLAV